MYVSFGDWSGGKVTPGNSQPAILSAGTLAPGASKMVYFYLQSPDSVDTTVGTTFLVKVWRFRPSSHSNSGFDSSFNFTLNVKDSLSAAGEPRTILQLLCIAACVLPRAFLASYDQFWGCC